LRLKILKKLRTTSLNSEFIGLIKKSVVGYFGIKFSKEQMLIFLINSFIISKNEVV